MNRFLIIFSGIVLFITSIFVLNIGSTYIDSRISDAIFKHELKIINENETKQLSQIKTLNEYLALRDKQILESNKLIIELENRIFKLELKK